MSDPIWWPAFMAEDGDTMPKGRPSPTAWLRWRGTARECGVEIGTAEDWRNEDERRRLVGDVVDFVQFRHLGTAKLVVCTDGTHQIIGDAPTDANLVWVRGDMETAMDTVKDLADWLRDEEVPLDLPVGMTFPIAFARWSDPIPHCLRRSATGPVAELLPTVSQNV